MADEVKRRAGWAKSSSIKWALRKGSHVMPLASMQDRPTYKSKAKLNTRTIRRSKH